MGIKGLLPFLEPIQKPVHISEFAGQRVAVDGHAWLHRGAFGCATALAMFQPTDSYVRFFMTLVGCLLYNNVTPIIVFDGQRLPMKQVTDNARAQTRMQKLEEGRRHQNMKDYKKAEKCFQQAINITPDIINKVIKALDEKGIQHIVAPYEADPQLTYLVKSGQASAVITEDSDLLAFGCPKIITKMDKTGNGKAISNKDIFTSERLHLKGFDETMFRHMCMITGCDYLPTEALSMNVNRAHFIVQNRRTLPEIMQSVRNRTPKPKWETYQETFPKAEAAFLYQFVFDVNTRTYIRLNPLPADMSPEHLVMLGESPQNNDIHILRSNNAAAINLERDLLTANKENIDPSFSQSDEFKEFELDDSALAEVALLLDKHEKSLPNTNVTETKTANTRPALGSKSTNVPTASVPGTKSTASVPSTKSTVSVPSTKSTVSVPGTKPTKPNHALGTKSGAKLKLLETDHSFYLLGPRHKRRNPFVVFSDEPNKKPSITTVQSKTKPVIPKSSTSHGTKRHSEVDCDKSNNIKKLKPTSM